MAKEVIAMDWLERLFHVDPDAGTGLFELALSLLVGLAVALLAVRLTKRSRRGRSGIATKGGLQ
jgi:hypothetical protein